MNHSIRAYCYLVATTLFWGANTVFARLAVGEISPMLLVSLRWLGAVLLFFVLFRSIFKTAWVKLKPDLLRLFILASIGLTGYNVVFYLAAHDTTALNMGIIQGLIPVFIILGAYLFQRVSVSWRQIIGVGLTVLGVVVVVSGGDFYELKSLGGSRGDYLMVVGCSFYAAYSLGLVRFVGKVAPLELFSILVVSAFLASLPFVGLEYLYDGLTMPSRQGWVVLLLITIFPSFLAQLFFIRGVTDIGPGRAGVFVNLVPIFASFLAIGVLGEDFHLYHAIALALVLAGIVLFERQKQMKKHA